MKVCDNNHLYQRPFQMKIRGRTLDMYSDLRWFEVYELSVDFTGRIGHMGVYSECGRPSHWIWSRWRGTTGHIVWTQPVRNFIIPGLSLRSGRCRFFCHCHFHTPPIMGSLAVMCVCDSPAAAVEAGEKKETDAKSGKKKKRKKWRAHVEIQRVPLYLRTGVEFFFFFVLQLPAL